MPTPRKTRAAAPPVDVIEPDQQWQQPAGTVLHLAQPPDDDPDIPLTAADRIAAMLQGATGDERAVVKLYRIQAPGKYEWCEDYTPEVFERGSEALIRSKWGAGEYMVRLYGSTIGKSGGMGYGVRAADTIRIAADASSPNPAAAMPAGIAQAIEAMAANQRQMLEAMNSRPAVDPMANMKEMLTLMTMMRSAMGGDAPRRERGLVDQLADLKALRDMAGELANGEKPEPADPLTAALPGLLELIKGAQRPAPDASPMPPVMLPADMTAPALTQPQETPAMPTVTDPAQAVGLLQKKLKTIMALAAANVDPEEGATILYEHLPDELVDVLRAPNWFESLQQFAPEAAPHREWLDKARGVFLGWIDNGHPDDAEPEDDPANPDSAA